MRVAFLVDAFPDLAVTFILGQITGLLRRGHEVDIYAQYAGRTDRLHPDHAAFGLAARTRYVGPPPSYVARIANAARELVTQPSRAAQLLGTTWPRCPEPEARSMRNFFLATGLRRDARYDVVHAHFGPNGVSAARLSEVGGLDLPLVTTFHGYDMRRGVESEGAIYDVLRRRGDAFLVISNYNRDLLLRWGFDAARIHAHPVGVDTTFFSSKSLLPPAAGPVRMLSVANLVAVKGHDVLLRALAELRRRGPERQFSLRVVGEGPERAALESLRDEVGLHDHVEYIGGRAQEEVRAELEDAHLFVLPSRAEATPVALMEAQSMRRPVIATRVGAVHEVVDAPHSGLLVDAGNVDALARAISDLLDRGDDWPKIGEAGRSHVLARYDQDTLVDRLVEIYEELV